MNDPWLSVVATARNDNHGGDLLQRMQVFVNGLAAQCARHRVRTELVLVEWNPPDDRPPLEQALDWPPESEWFRARIVVVPPELHARQPLGDRLPLFQMLAKNVGIRRARGRFVLATNVDLIFSDGLMHALAERPLDHATLYRADRHDVEFEVDPEAPIEELLAACEANTIRICGRDATRDLRNGEVHRIYRRQLRRLPDAPYVSVAISSSWLVRYVVLRSLAFVAGRRARYRYRSLGRRLLGQPALPPLPPVRTPGQATEPLAYALHNVRQAWRSQRAIVRLHTNGCGDFTLLAREAWERLRGYPELRTFSMHLDSMLLYLAHYAGLREQVLPHPVYHLEHGHGFRPDAENVRSLNERLERSGIPQVSMDEFLDWAHEMRLNGGPIEFNDDDWGFATETLREVTPTTRAPAPVQEVAQR